MAKITHASIWKKNSSEKHAFVSELIYRSLPVMKKDKKIRHVLDVACGNGMGVTLPMLRAGYKVTAFDHTSAAVNAVRKNAAAEKYPLIVSKASMHNDFKFKDNSFDAATCFQAICHGRLEQMMHVLAEMKRVVRKDGYVFVNFMSHEHNVLFDSDKKGYYYTFKKLDGTVDRGYMRQDRYQPHLFYYTGDWENGVPHYYSTKAELEVILGMYFKKFKIIKHVRDSGTVFWYVEARV